MSEHRIKSFCLPFFSWWLGGPIDVKTADDYLAILEVAVQSRKWKQLPQQERMRLVDRLSHIREIAKTRDLILEE
jgi:hypothetical protein